MKMQNMMKNLQKCRKINNQIQKILITKKLMNNKKVVLIALMINKK